LFFFVVVAICQSFSRDAIGIDFVCRLYCSGRQNKILVATIIIHAQSLQIKPAMENLLNLTRGGLTKEIKLTQELMELVSLV
jgi:hypothetical protein